MFSVENQKTDDLSSSTSLSLLDDVSLSNTFESTVPNPRCAFKKGDKVRFVGSNNSGLNSASLTGPFFVPSREDSKKLSFSSSSNTINPLSSSRPSNTTRHGPSVGYTGKVMLTFDDNPRKVGVRFDKTVPGGINLGNLCEDNHGYFVDASELKHELDPVPDESADCLTIEVLFEILTKEENQPCIFFVRNFEKTILVNYERYLHLKKELEKLDSRTLFIALIINTTGKDKSERPGFLLSSKSGGGNHTALLDVSFLDHLSRMEDRKETTKTSKIISKMFPCKINTHPPVNQTQLTEWQKQIAQDRQKMKTDSNITNLKKLFAKNGLACNNLDSITMKRKVFSRNQIEKVVGWSFSDHIMNSEGKTDGDTINIDAKSVEAALRMLEQSNPPKIKSIYDIETDNDFEKRLLSDVIPPNELKIGFDDIGALDKVKDTLKELVMLPLQRPELFRKGNLTKPCKGILLFGPPERVKLC